MHDSLPCKTNRISCNSTLDDSAHTEKGQILQHHGQCIAIMTPWNPLPQTNNIVHKYHCQIVTAILNLFSMRWLILH